MRLFVLARPTTGIILHWTPNVVPVSSHTTNDDAVLAGGLHEEMDAPQHTAPVDTVRGNVRIFYDF
jgi:hypothetical protein